MSAERRRTIRAVARIEVQDKDHPRERVPLYISGNVSEGGLFLITMDPYAPGTELSVKFNLPDDQKPIEAMGTVIWKRDQRQNPKGQPGMGVQFMNISKTDRERICKFVEAQAEEDDKSSKKP
jgi:uncharacterized protein (TIGR02266 family)